MPVPGIRALQETLCAPSSHHQARPFSACHLRLQDMAAVQPEVGASVVEVAAEVEEAELTTASTRTHACPTCSRALSKNTWTRFTSGPVKWPGAGTGAERDLDPTNHTLTPTHMRTHTPTLKGSHQPT